MNLKPRLIVLKCSQVQKPDYASGLINWFAGTNGKFSLINSRHPQADCFLCWLVVDSGKLNSILNSANEFNKLIEDIQSNYLINESGMELSYLIAESTSKQARNIITVNLLIPASN